MLPAAKTTRQASSTGLVGQAPDDRGDKRRQAAERQSVASDQLPGDGDRHLELIGDERQDADDDELGRADDECAQGQHHEGPPHPARAGHIRQDTDTALS
jgi:hypothetical protein